MLRTVVCSAFLAVVTCVDRHHIFFVCCLQMSLKQRCSHLTSHIPTASSPKKFLGVQPRSICLTWPSHLRYLQVRTAIMWASSHGARPQCSSLCPAKGCAGCTRVTIYENCSASFPGFHTVFPGFTTVECAKDASLINMLLGALHHMSVVPHFLVQPGHDSCSIGHPAVYSASGDRMLEMHVL